MSHVAGVSDAARARELYRYFRPSSSSIAADICVSSEQAGDLADGPEPLDEINVRSEVTSSKVSSPDTALTVFSQLVSWRIGTQRAMISVIDNDTQHFIAESTKTLDLIDNRRHGEGDALWMGCNQVSKSGRLCERTIALPPAPAGEYAAFIIPDLSQDDRFNQLPFVIGPPFLKFYAGTPLVTRRGIPIGSLFVVDDRVRQGLNPDQIHFMGTMAGTIMRHLEMVREVEEHRRGMKMSRGLASFVEGRAHIVEGETDVEDGEGMSVAGQFEIPSTVPNTRSETSRPAISRNGSGMSIERKEKEYSRGILKTEEAIMASLQHGNVITKSDQGVDIPDAGPPLREGINADVADVHITSPSRNVVSPESAEESEVSTLKTLFSRAANLIREAFEIDGGSVFYDAQRGFGNEYSQETAAGNSMHVSDLSSEDSRSNSDSTQAEQSEYSRTQRQARAPSTTGEMFHPTPLSSDGQVEILGFSTPSASSVHGDTYPGGHSFIQFDEKSLQGLLRRYPRGKIWTFDQDGIISSSEEDVALKAQPGTGNSGQLRKKLGKDAAEAALLPKHFSGVRQLLFVPLWDASRSRWLSGNFTWSTDPTRILSKQSELAFLTAFGNSVMAECSRLDTEIADQKKGDFIGSISHELRSPLHGILASAEFLSDEVTGAFAKGLVETIDSCGRTLLDTINHILDFSKINHLEKNWRRSKRGGTSKSRPGARSTNSFASRKVDLPMINLFADVDISIVCEEVVEGVFAGHVFQNITAPSFDIVADSRGKMSHPRKQIIRPSTMVDSDNPSHYPNVAVILDIDAQNYHFTTQPGALRRVVMNLLGNALKYTMRGYVKIKLETMEMEDFCPVGSTESIQRACVVLTVTDTGKGISSDFIRTKLFTPFAQENSLSSGTGLGLSIVRSIVSLLEGDIAIKSEIGRGTEVKVTLPVLREMPKGSESSGSTTKSVSSVPKESEEVIEQLRPRVVGKTVALSGFNSDADDAIESQTNQLLKSSIKNFLSNWYGLKVVSEREKPDIIVVNEPSDTDIARLTQLRPNNKRSIIILPLYSNSSRFDRIHSAIGSNENINFLAKPIGPLKLARAISQCLDGVPLLGTPTLDRSPSGLVGAAHGPNDLSNIFEELSSSPSGGEILDNSRMAAGSDNARKVIESPTPTQGVEKKEFPFPTEPQRPSVLSNTTILTDQQNQSPAKESTEPHTLAVPSTVESIVSGSTAATPPPSTSRKPNVSAPRLLLVDDNRINLRLLGTYMRRRKYRFVDEAENGLEAVNAVQNCEEGYDIIFMDISMPVLDGFDATRQIRRIERARSNKGAQEGLPTPSPALIIALTGLASSRDQSEAFTSGIDLFLTKPVAFKEVGKMLDNWEANREREAQQSGEGAAMVS